MTNYNYDLIEKAERKSEAAKVLQRKIWAREEEVKPIVEEAEAIAAKIAPFDDLDDCRELCARLCELVDLREEYEETFTPAYLADARDRWNPELSGCTIDEFARGKVKARRERLVISVANILGVDIG